MRWTDQMVQALARGSSRASQVRTARALAKYKPILELPEISTEVLKKMGYARPFNIIRVLKRNGLLERVRRVPQHTVYKAKEMT